MAKGKEDRSGNITAGMILVILGAIFLTGQMGLVSFSQIWRYWPVALLAIGVTHLVLPDASDRWIGGVMNILLGLVFLAINWHWMGLDWDSGWPLILVAIGASMVLRAMFSPRRSAVTPGSNATVVEEERHV